MWRPLPSGAEKQRRRRASPSPAADPPRRPRSCSLRPPRGHAGASPALTSVACSQCSAASPARRPPFRTQRDRPPPLPSPGPGPLRRQHGGREDLQQRGSYLTAASPPGAARGSRAEQGRGPHAAPPGGATAARRPWGRGTTGAPPRAPQGWGRAGGGPVPEAAAPRSRVGSTEDCPPPSPHPHPALSRWPCRV